MSFITSYLNASQIVNKATSTSGTPIPLSNSVAPILAQAGLPNNIENATITQTTVNGKLQRQICYDTDKFTICYSVTNR